MKLYTARTIDFSAVTLHFGFTNAFFSVVNGNRCHTKQSLFDEWHAALRMYDNPDKNWDAFDDSLNQMFDSLETTEIVILVTSADSILEDLPPDERPRQVKILLDTLSRTTGEGMFVNEPDRLDLERAGVFLIADHGRAAQLDHLIQSTGVVVPEFTR